MKKLSEKALNAVNQELDLVYKNDKSMKDYHLKNISNIFMFDDGRFIVFEKKSLKTRFCFGYSDCGQGSSFEKAQELSNKAERDSEIFIKENLEDIESTIKEFKENDVYIISTHFNKGKNQVNLCSDYNMRYHSRENSEKISEKDKLEIISILKEEKAKMIKRVETYLKRFGLSKIRSWYFWVDA